MIELIALGMIFSRVLGLAGGDADQLDGGVGEDDALDDQQHGQQPVREERRRCR